MASLWAGKQTERVNRLRAIGSLSGSVVDASSTPAAFATVCLTGTILWCVADERGTFRLPNIRSGLAKDGAPPQALGALRAPAYFRLDARIDRNGTIVGKPVIVFFGVQNLGNVGGYTWNRRTNSAEANGQLGLFPLLGLEWRF